MNKSMQHIFIELLKSSKIKGLFDRNIFGPLVKRSKSQFVLRLERRKCRETSLQSLKNSSFVYHVIQYQTMAECCYHHMLHSGLMQHFFCYVCCCCLLLKKDQTWWSGLSAEVAHKDAQCMLTAWCVHSTRTATDCTPWWSPVDECVTSVFLCLTYKKMSCLLMWRLTVCVCLLHLLSSDTPRWRQPPTSTSSTWPWPTLCSWLLYRSR